MWTPASLATHADTLRELGLELDPAALTDPMAYPLGAVVWLGGCSASFVSAEGLIITNHHCAGGALQFNSVGGDNLLRDGFLAKSRADERSNGPAAKVYVTQAFTDVTSRVRDGLAEEPDDLRRHELLEERDKELVAECERGRPSLRCTLVEYFGGEQYLLVEQLEIRDLRLVYAPAEGVGNFGGEIDNWRWPRHVGDYAFFRAYVGPDGKPADHDAANRPYRPRHHLTVANRPLAPGDLVLVAGYPAVTTRLKTAREVSETVSWYYPRRIAMCEDYIALLERMGAQDSDLAIKGARLLRGLNNVLTNTRGMLDGLQKGGLEARKALMEEDLRRFIAEHPEHAVAGVAIDSLAEDYTKYRSDRDREAAHGEALFMSALLGAANTIVRMAEERPKPDAERDPAYQERNHKRIEQAQEHAQRTYARALDQAKLELALTRAAKLSGSARPEILALVLGDAEATPASLATALGRLYQQTELEDLTVRLGLLRSATTDELKQSQDPFIQLALNLRPVLQAAEDRADAYSGATMLDRPAYVAALRASRGGRLAPDANSTLRVSYGTVRGYRPAPAADTYFPFTTLSEMVAKHTGKPPFEVPAAVLKAARSGPYAPYSDATLGELPVNFLADLDITGGNSGSPTLNARGELVGLAFDGNYEAMASDWIFMPAITRSIHVDIRYVLWLMDYVDGADHLLREMGIQPAGE